MKRALSTLALALILVSCGKSSTSRTAHITPSADVASNPDIVTSDTLTVEDITPAFQHNAGAVNCFGIYGRGDSETVYYCTGGHWEAAPCQHLNDGRWMCAVVGMGARYFIVTKSGS